ncbi:hypothetical protein HH308_18355 [Gordonia sp. TBRC 11910]|uniref:MspA protein n=1 Tax=Gordonia asplenii TaxID=2725283 RepID=A0A848KXV5_9ACTN|nr:MspA family porin [Gordonia asplenii]NMO03179.1 hypothetical protein [Gordonia asplenii]
MTRYSLARSARLFGTAVTVFAALALTTPHAQAAPLPGGYAARTLDDGTRVTVRLVGEKVGLQGASVAATPTTREGWLSGTVEVSVNGKAVNYTAVSPGYDVGCQVNFSGGGASGGAGGDTQGASNNVNAGAVVTLGPGKAAWVPVIATTSGDTTAYKYYTVNSYTFTGPSGSVTYSQQPFRINGCAGYAAARARIIVEVSTPSVRTWITLIGQQFTLG